MQRPACAGRIQFVPQPGERLRVAVVAIDVAQARVEPGECTLVDAALAVDQAVADPIAQAVERATPGDADDRHLQFVVTDQRLQRRVDLLVGQVAGRAEKDERVRRCLAPRHSLQPCIGTMVISTRRFCARPDSVSLLAIGRVSPAPVMIMRCCMTPRLER